MIEWLHRLAAPEDRILFALLALVVGYAALGALVGRRGRGEPTRPSDARE
jgi:hypothetical protein